MAWTHHHVSSRLANWKSLILEILRQKTPAPQLIKASLSHGRDFHLWIDDTIIDRDREWKIREISTGDPSWKTKMGEAMGTSTVIVLLGFNVTSPPVLYYLSAERRRDRPDSDDSGM